MSNLTEDEIKLIVQILENTPTKDLKSARILIELIQKLQNKENK